ncbi:MAG: glycerol-3-phosphate dehydrogenase, partial [Rhodobacteraceae bacterium]|nr:glycerol-3-phosphate dehydrogenase [Paracoccaceae bacterium]
ITTYRRLAESALDQIAPFFPGMPGPWTAGVALPGGDFPVDGVTALIEKLRHDYPFLTDRWAKRLIRAYGTDAHRMLGQSTCAADLGPDFGATLTGREVTWLMEKEYARTAEDVVWRRSKLGLRLTAEQVATLDDWIDAHCAASLRAAAE